MKTLRTKKIDGIEIITGIGELSICGIKTRENGRPLIAELPEAVELGVKGDEGIAKLNQGYVERKKAADFLKRNEQSQSQIHSNKANDLFAAANVVDDEMREIKTRLAPKQKEILRSNPHFHEPGRDLLQKLEAETWPEYLARIPVLETAYLGKGANQQVKTDGAVIQDFRGEKYSKKISGTWGFGTITGLDVGLPTGAVWDKDLTEIQKTEISDQNENERMAGLSVEGKTAEYNSKVAGLAGQAQAMENELKFSGDPAYVAKAQAFYDTEILILNTKYGV